MTSRFCGSCGTMSSPSDLFCTSCGTAVPSAATSPEMPAQRAGLSPVGQTSETFVPGRDEPAPHHSAPFMAVPTHLQDIPPPRPMSFGEAIQHGFKNYAVFRGRASRSEYWFLYLFYTLVLIGSSTISGLVDIGVVLVFLTYATFAVPLIAAAVRRLHDTGRSGHFLWLGLIPCVGAILLLIVLCQRGSLQANEYGPGA